MIPGAPAPDPTGVVVVTGATSGIGLATAQRLASQGRAVYLVGRHRPRTDAAVEHVGRGAGVAARGFVADLSSQRAVRMLAERLSRAAVTDGLAVRAIVHSAGLYTSRPVLTEDRIELTAAVNHFAPFLLTHEILTDPELRTPRMRVRIVVVSSNAHRGARLDPTRFARPAMHRGHRSYKRAKLANVLFVNELARRFTDVGVDAHAVDPGLVDTQIGSKHSGPASRAAWALRRRRGAAPEVPARLIAALATGTIGGSTSGGYWRDGRTIPPSARALDRDLADALWRVSCDVCAIDDVAWNAARTPVTL